MARKLTLQHSGDSVSVTLPRDMADRLLASSGDNILAIETNRGILLTPYDPTTVEAMEIAARASHQHREALRDLAK